MKLLLATIWYFALGSTAYLIVINANDFVVPKWIDDFYYLWGAIKDAAFFSCFFLIKEKDIKDIRAGKYNYALVPTAIYFGIRLIWATIKPLTKLAKDYPGMVTTIFTGLLIILIMFLWIDLRKRAREL